MAFIYLDNGWQDESTEDPYIEQCQTKQGFSVYRRTKFNRIHDMYIVEYKGEEIALSDTYQEGIDFVDSLID